MLYVCDILPSERKLQKDYDRKGPIERKGEREKKISREAQVRWRQDVLIGRKRPAVH
jgi:hypothetical protein